MATKISIDVETRFLPEQSDPDKNHYVFAYTITISNYEDVAVQLLSRHWLIRDANNKMEEVIGEGVVGEQPVIEPQQSYQYSSGAILGTEVGTMEGFYQMQYPKAETKNVKIPQFTLSVPRIIH